jgi:oxygen-independent coproporphyrinogen-3 oxidase
MAGIYLHIPFCKQACYYCDFHFSTNKKEISTLIDSMTRELELQKSYLGGEVINTIYFGGGTPSLMAEDEFVKLFSAIKSNFHVSPSAEITIEANPDDLYDGKIDLLKNLNVNRLSVGIQSFDDAVLRFLNRAHTGADAIASVERIRRAGFSNVSIDLIYAIPGQEIELWQKNIKQALALSPEHISSYSLTIEDKTVFGRWAAKGKFKAVADDNAAIQLEMLVEMLEVAGFEQYEVSNFAQPGFYSRHNSSYWRGEKYLGVGPSAHSYNSISRQFNIANNHLYIQSLKENVIPFTEEKLSNEDRVNDYLLTTLRTSWGTDLEYLKTSWGYPLEEYQSYINTLLDNLLAELRGNQLVLTKSGKLLADKIASDLFLVKQD